MAKIGKIFVRIYGKGTNIDIKYSRPKECFYSDFTPEIKEWAGVGKKKIPTAKTEADLKEKIKKFIKEYEAQKVIEKMVIAYKFESYSRTIKQKNRWGHSDGGDEDEEARLDFNYRVLRRRTVGKHNKYFHPTERDNNYDFNKRKRIEGDYKCIDRDICEEDWIMVDWTKEREEFFKGFYKAIEILIKRIRSFTATPVKMINFINSGTKLLPGPEKPKFKRTTREKKIQKSPRKTD